jgi:hypothetical protein
MRRALIPALFVVVLLLSGLVSGRPQPSAAENGTPMASPGSGTPAPAPVCTPIEIARGDLVAYMPPGMAEGAVSLFHPPGVPDDDESLFLTVLTLPPASCMDYRNRSGAVVFYVQEGTIEYTAHAVNPDPTMAPVITMGRSGGLVDDAVAVPLDTPTTLHATDWLTQDRAVWFSFRNAGAVDAVVSVAMYVVPWDDDPCAGQCRKP